MRMMPVMAAAVAIGLSLMIVGGFGVSIGPDTGQGDSERALQDNITDQGDNTSLEPEAGSEGSGFFSFAVGALQEMRSLFGILLFLPGTLNELGLPKEAARAVGHSIQLVIAVGLIQIALQFDIR